MLRTTTTVLLLVLAAPAVAGPRDRGADRLWATVNICVQGTDSEPGSFGIRASMPGMRRKGAMYMRFRAQYLSRLDGKWHNPPAADADSGFIRVGSARDRSSQSGWTFRFRPGADGAPLVLRGAVDYEWRRKGKVRRRARRLTEAGHVSDVGSRPKGFSAATCRLTAQ